MPGPRRAKPPQGAQRTVFVSGSSLAAIPRGQRDTVTGPRLLALDFDGVICDTVHEGCRSAWQVCRDLVTLEGEVPPPELAAVFVRLRPVLEHGWEFPVLVLAILDGIPEATIWDTFQTTCRQRILDKYRVTPKEFAARFDAARDRTIARSLDDWLAGQGLYPGMAERLCAIQQSGLRMYVVTTKEGRFAHKLLETHGVRLPRGPGVGQGAGTAKAGAPAGPGAGRACGLSRHLVCRGPPEDPARGRPANVTSQTSACFLPSGAISCPPIGTRRRRIRASRRSRWTGSVGTSPIGLCERARDTPGASGAARSCGREHATRRPDGVHVEQFRRLNVWARRLE